MVRSAVLAASLVSGIAPAARGEGWEFGVAPYLWLPSIEGTLRYELPSGAGRTADVKVGADDYVDNIEFAFLIAGEARRSAFFVATDVVFLQLSESKSRVESVEFAARVPVTATLDAGSESSLDAVVWSLVGGYELVRSERGVLGALAGFRFTSLSASTDWRLTTTVDGPGPGQTFPASGSVSKDDDLWDAVIGFRGRVRLGDGAWALPGYVDIGTGNSDLTWQGALGLLYGFDRIDVSAFYRHLAYDGDGTNLAKELSMSGLALGVAFRFGGG